MHPGVKTPRYVVELARDMRKNPTPAEKKLWEALKEGQIEGYKFRSQHPIFRYILDFYCDERSLAIEVDGPIHDNTIEYDQEKDKFIAALGIRTIRFKNKEVENDIDMVINKIRQELKTTT
ncbi:MAG: endonuclease domain-containing protein [bacterium]|nr:endonuclease domain-containing protein [bacterium]